MPLITSKTSDGGDAFADYNKLPTVCPICHHAMHPTQVQQSAIVGSVLELVMRCPNAGCGHLLIGRYSSGGNTFHMIKNVHTSVTFYNLKEVVPQTAKNEVFDENVVGLSPSFVKIYNQALAAEAAGLEQIVGIGLRKALEFLIKDYCIYKNPTKAEEIKKSMLAKVIGDYIGDTNIKQCASRAVWLGNDETHYVRLWESHDLDDLKVLINLTVHWIAHELLTQKYIAEMVKRSQANP